ncbi:MAG: hypothetical protein CMJ46_13630 [Planctomyces sp.]|nr:hypothetical protein [Planctomyces sp.]
MPIFVTSTRIRSRGMVSGELSVPGQALQRVGCELPVYLIGSLRGKLADSRRFEFLLADSRKSCDKLKLLDRYRGKDDHKPTPVSSIRARKSLRERIHPGTMEVLFRK